MEELVIKPMIKSDLLEVCAIEREVFPDPWSTNMFEEEIELPEMYSLIAARFENQLVGYGGLLHIREDGHITNLAVDPLFQGQGVGKAITYQIFLLALDKGIRNISLEVRTTNLIAQELYKHFGFKVVAVRKNYYGYEEDALVMSVENIENPAYLENLKGIEKTLRFDILDG